MIRREQKNNHYYWKNNNKKNRNNKISQNMMIHTLFIIFAYLIPVTYGISGGKNSTSGDFLVWTVSIGVSTPPSSPPTSLQNSNNNNNNNIPSSKSTTLCTGTLLSNEWVLTTSSCLNKLLSQSNSDKNNENIGGNIHSLRIYAGCIGGPTTSCSQILSGSKIYKHPCYDGTNVTEPSLQQNDMALLKLQAPGVAVGSQTHFPLLDKLVDGAYLTPADNAIVSGWGHTGYNNSNHDKKIMPTKLQTLTMPFISLSSCKAKFLELDGTYSTKKDFKTPSVVCAGNGMAHMPCDEDDNGAPLTQINNNGQRVLVGIFLHLTPSPQRYPQVDRHNPVMQPNLCNISGRFAIFQRTATYRDWILDTISTGKEIDCITNRKLIGEQMINNNDKTFSSAAAAAAGVENADSSALVARGRRFHGGIAHQKVHF